MCNRLCSQGREITGAITVVVVTLTEGRWVCALEVGEKVRRDGLKLVLPEGSVTRGFTRGVPHDLRHLCDPADLPQPGQDQAHERQANCELHRSRTMPAIFRGCVTPHDALSRLGLVPAQLCISLYPLPKS